MSDVPTTQSMIPKADFSTTGDPRCPLALLLDVSDSMGEAQAGRRPAIDQLNDGLLELKRALGADDLARRRVEPAVVTFGGSVKVLSNFVPVANWEPPLLTAGGSTPLGAAIHTGIGLVRQRRREIAADGLASFKPWIFLITDGSPTDDWIDAAQRASDAEARGDLVFFTVAADGADTDVLSRISRRPTLRLPDNRWSELFVWLSDSLQSVSSSRPGRQVAIEPWMV